MLKKLVAFVFVMLLAMPALAEELNTKYFTVNTPEGWKAIMPPTENQASSTVIFSNASGSATVGFVAGPSGGTDAKTIADMFAKQFKAAKPPVERNGQYFFNFTQQQAPHQSWVATMGETFMVTTFSGDRKEGTNFIKKRVKSAEFAELLPK